MSEKEPSRFAKALGNKLKEKGLKPIDLEKKSKNKITRQNLSRYLNDTRHPKTGALPKATEKFCALLAKYLDWDIDQVREAAGFIALNQRGVQEIAARLAGSVMASGFDDLKDEDLREAYLEDMETIAESMLKRRLEEQRKKPTNGK